MSGSVVPLHYLQLSLSDSFLCQFADNFQSEQTRSYLRRGVHAPEGDPSLQQGYPEGGARDGRSAGRPYPHTLTEDPTKSRVPKFGTRLPYPQCVTVTSSCDTRTSDIHPPR